MKINEKERTSTLAMTRLKMELQRVMIEHMKTTDPWLTTHELIYVLIELVMDANRNALRREHGKDED